MDVYKDIDAALAEMGFPYYHGMPDFAGIGEPETYISYTLREKPVYYSSGEANALSVWIALSVLSPVADSEIYQTIKNVMKKNGYEYQGGNDVGTTTTFPCKKHYSMDFIKKYYKEK